MGQVSTRYANSQGGPNPGFGGMGGSGQNPMMNPQMQQMQYQMQMLNL